MPFWSSSSTTLPNDVTYVNNTYKDSNGNNQLTTISSANPTGYVPVNSNSTDPIVKKLSYAVQTDGKITYQYDDGTGNKIQYNSIQQIANDFGISGYTDATTAKIKDSMQSNLSTSAAEKKVGPSTASTTETGESDKYDAEAIATTQKELDKLPSGIGDGSSNREYENLRYPKEIDTSNQDYILFSMLKYEPTKINLSNAATKDSILSRSTSSKSIGTVSMAIQGPISDMNSVGYNDGNMNPLQALAAATALAGISAGAEGAKGALSAVGSLISDTSANKALKTATKAYFAGQGIQNQELFTRTTGAIANPNIELLFNAPQLREFSFTFILSPRDEDESTEVRKIIRFFKQGMSVKKSSTGLFLKTPNTFLITYVQKGDDEDNGAKYLPKIKECALQSFGVDYTPAQTYSTYYNNSMTAYQLTMGFKELTPIYDNDYTDLDSDKDTYIGY